MANLRVFLFSIVLLLAFGCGETVEKETTGIPGEGNLTFYKASGGSEWFLMPIVGTRVDDGSVFIGAFTKYCHREEKDPIDWPYSNTQYEKLDESKKSVYGGPYQSGGGCFYDLEFKFENGKISAFGDLNGNDNNAFDIEFTEIPEDEFYQILKEQTEGKGLNYRKLEEDTRDQFDKVCKELSGVETCQEKF